MDVNQKLLILHQNVRHGRVETEQLIINAFLSKSQILCVQEPWDLRYFKRFFRVHCFQDDPLCAIATSLDCAMMVTQVTTRHCVCTEFNLRQPFILCSVYFPPSEDLEHLLEELRNVIVFAGSRRLVLTGDFNAWNEAWGSRCSNSRGDRVLEFMNSFGLFVVNHGNEPTFETVNGSSIIDVTFANGPAISMLDDWKVSDAVSLSDHKLIEFSWFLSNPIPQRTCSRRFKTKNINWEPFIYAATPILAGLCDKAESLESAPQVDDFALELDNTLVELCEKTLPLISGDRPLRVFYFDKELRDLSCKVVRARRSFQRQRDPVIREQAKLYFLDLSKSYKKAIAETKRKALREFFTSRDRDSIWNTVYKWCSKPASVNQSLSTIRSGPSFTSSVAETAEVLLGEFFPEDTPNSQYQEDIVRRVSEPYSTTCDPPFTFDEVKEVILRSKDKKSPGHNGLTANIYKTVFGICPSLLVCFFNKCKRFSVFPSSWKISNVILIPKPKSSKFRPINMLNVGSKYLEQLISERISFFLRSTPGTIDFNQFGFTPQKSAVQAISAVVNVLEATKSNNQFAVVVSLDITGAFDSVWWPVILFGLRRFSVPCDLYRMIENFLCNREARLYLSGQLFQKGVSRGCPQGAKLSPLLWNLVYSDMLKLDLPLGCSTQAFADDAILISVAPDLDTAISQANISLALIASRDLVG